MVWGPRAAHDDLNTGQMASRHLVAVLVFLNFFVVYEMGDVNQHAPGIDFAATNILVKRGENLVDLDGKGAGLGLPLVQGLAELHGGTLAISSILGAGFTAMLELPAA